MNPARNLLSDLAVLFWGVSHPGNQSAIVINYWLSHYFYFLQDTTPKTWGYEWLLFRIKETQMAEFPSQRMKLVFIRLRKDPLLKFFPLWLPCLHGLCWSNSPRRASLMLRTILSMLRCNTQSSGFACGYLVRKIRNGSKGFAVFSILC